MMRLLMMSAFVLVLFCGTGLALNYEKKELYGTWVGQMGDIDGYYEFKKNGDYKSTFTIFGMKMIAMGQWSIDGDSIRLDQKETIEAGKKGTSSQTFMRKIQTLTGGTLRTIHKDALDRDVISEFKKK